MVTPNNTWYFDLNRDDANPVTLAAQTTQTEQYQNTALNLIRFLTGVAPATATGAWSVVASSNSVVASAANNITTPADIVFAAAGVAHTWIVLSNTGVRGGGATYLTLDFTNVAGDVNPSDYQIYLAHTAPTGGTTTARPTAANETTALNSRVVANLSGGVTYPATTTHGWRNSRGEFAFYTSSDGTGVAECAIVILSPQNGFNPTYNVLLFAANAFGGATTSWFSSSFWRGFKQTATPASSVVIVSATSAMSSWTVGSDALGNYHHAGMEAVYNASDGCYYGVIEDVRGVPLNIPPNTDYAPDPDPIIMKAMGLIALPTPTATGLTL